MWYIYTLARILSNIKLALIFIRKYQHSGPQKSSPPAFPPLIIVCFAKKQLKSAMKAE